MSFIGNSFNVWCIHSSHGWCWLDGLLFFSSFAIWWIRVIFLLFIYYNKQFIYLLFFLLFFTIFKHSQRRHHHQWQISETKLMAKNDIKLLGVWASTFVMRAHISLNIKYVNYEFLKETIGSKSELLLQSNPIHKKVTVLRGWFSSSSSTTINNPFIYYFYSILHHLQALTVPPPPIVANL